MPEFEGLVTNVEFVNGRPPLRWRRRDRHRLRISGTQRDALPLELQTLHPGVLFTALELADGDISRLRVDKEDGSITVVNASRKPRWTHNPTVRLGPPAR